MRFNCQAILFIMTLMLSCSLAWSQTCSTKFPEITPECISKSPLKFVGKPITLRKELQDKMFFYKTPSGGIGKLKIIGTEITPVECTVFIDAVTYGGDQIFVPNSSLTTSVDKNHWLRGRIYLDKEGLSALEMARIPANKDQPDGGEVCALVLSQNATIAAYTPEVDPDQGKETYWRLFYVPLLLIFIAIFLIVRVFMEEQDKFKTQEALEDAETAKSTKNQNLFIKITRPFYKRYFVPLVQGSKNRQGIKTKWRKKLANAGLAKEMTPEEFVALKFFMILGAPFAFLAARAILETDWPLTITPVMALVGYFYPNIWLSGLISKRSDQVLRAMPFIVDMLALSVEAGLDFMAAIQRVIEKAPPSPLVEEFETLIKETKIGSSRAEGLRQLGWRVNIIEINSFCATLIAADSVGASIAPILKLLSVELRVKRSSRAEQQGATAATKILIPMVFFILPAVLVAIFAPMFLKLVSGKM